MVEQHCACHKVLRTIKTGVLLDLIRSPPPFKPRDIPINPEKRLWLHQELDRAIEKGAYEPPTCLDYWKLTQLLSHISCVRQYKVRAVKMGSLQHQAKCLQWLKAIDF